MATFSRQRIRIRTTMDRADSVKKEEDCSSECKWRRHRSGGASNKPPSRDSVDAGGSYNHGAAMMKVIYVDRTSSSCSSTGTRH